MAIKSFLLRGNRYKSKTLIFGAPAGGLEPAVLPQHSPTGALTINCTLGTADASGFTAQVDKQLQISATVGTAAADGFTAQVDRQLKVGATLGTANASGFLASINLKLEIIASLGTADASGFTATISGAALNINCALGTADAFGYLASATFVVWPLPADVKLGVVYGPNGNDYTGTYVAVDTAIKYDLTTGRLVKPISSKIVMSL